MFWDSSALVPWLLPETWSSQITGWLRGDDQVILWWASPVEVHSALFRRHRRHDLPLPVLTTALGRLDTLGSNAHFITPTDRVRDRARRLLSAHPLSAADALQLAAALVWCDEAPHGERFVSLDERLRAAARREGFSLLPEAT